MGITEIVLIVIIGVFVVGVAVKAIVDRKRGKCSCDCCDGHCSCCQKYKEATEQQKNGSTESA